MSEDEETSVVYVCYVLVATHHEHIKIGAYLALAGVIALLLSLVLLSVISTCLLQRKPERTRGGVTCELLEDPTHPYQYSYLETDSGEKQNPLRESSNSDHYAKPFNPGSGISLSSHFLPCDEPHIQLHRGKINRPHSSLEKGDNVPHQNQSDRISGYTFQHEHVILQPKGDNSDDDDYEPVGFHEIYENRVDNYGSQTDGEYVSVKTNE